MTRHYLHLVRSLPARGLVIAALLAALVPAVADAGTFAAYGPREFFRDPDLGPTQSEFFTETFSVTDPSLTYTIRVERIRANLVEIDINGTQVVKRRDFIDAGGDVVEKTVSLWDVNLLELEMQADPDGLVTITIFGPDDHEPIITAVVDPEPNDAGWNDTPVTVSFDCSDITSGIAVCPAAIYQDTEVDGRVIQGQAVDLAGNTAEASVTVSVDLSLPSVSITSHMDGEVISTPVINVLGTMSDGFSGIDTVTCNGEAATLYPLDSSFECEVDLYLGGNTIEVEATDLAGNVATDSVTVVLDTTDIIKQLVDDQAPTIVIDQPADGSEVAVTAVTAEATVAGKVLDLLQGFTQSKNVEVVIDVTAALGAGTVAVDSAEAEVSNGTFAAAGVRLRRGTNIITATATDAAGNVGTDSVTVTVRELSGQRIEEVSGDEQSGEVGTELAEDLVVQLLDAAGSGASGRNVTFEVSGGAGSVDGGAGAGRSATVATDSDGLAAVAFTLGQRSGAGNHRVTASATGFAGSVAFTASATPGAAVAVKESSPTDRTGQPLTVLPEPLVVYAHDAFGNPVADADVDLDVVDFTGGIIDVGEFTASGPSITRTSGDDGRVAAFFRLGDETEDRNSNVATAKLSGAVDPPDGSEPLPVTFKLSPRTANSGVTSVFGIVLDQNYEPLSGVDVTLIDAPIEDTDADCALSGASEEIAATGGDGIFTFTNTAFTDRRITLFADGSSLGTATGQLCLEVVAYAGRATNVGPVFLPVLETAVDAGGGATLELDDLPISTTANASLTGTATCPGGGGACDISFTRLANDQLPALPPRGRVPAAAWTVQPLGVTFATPAALMLPNTGDFAAGETVDLWEFDHDLAQFVRFGTATVSDDGTSIASDEGFGIRRSGVGYAASSLLENTWAFSCDDGNQCTCDNPDADLFVEQPVICPPAGLDLDLGTPDFNTGLCFHQPLSGPCEDGLYCTTEDGVQPDDFVYTPDACEGGGCSNGTKVDDVDITGTGGALSARLEVDLTAIKDIKDSFSRFQSLIDAFSSTCVFEKDIVPNVTAKAVERCCESETKIVNAYQLVPQLFGSVSYKCNLLSVPSIKGLITVKGNVGLSAIGKFQADFDVSLCPDDDCEYDLTAIFEVEPFGELEIDILSGAAGASAKIAYPVGVNGTTTCTCEDELFTFFEDSPGIDDLFLLGPLPFAVEFATLGTSNCSDVKYQACAGPLRIEGRIKLLGFIKIGFDYEVPNTKFCGALN